MTRKAREQEGGKVGNIKGSWISERPLLFVSLLAVVIGTVYVGGFAGCRTPALSEVTLCKNSLTQPWATLIAGTLVLLGAILTYLSTEKTRGLTRQELNHTQDEAERVHQRQMESALNDRFVTAVEQLGNKEQDPVKLGGVYSLMALAEDWVAFGEQSNLRERARKQAQVCVDVLCSYVKSNTHVRANPNGAGIVAGAKLKSVSRPESDLRAVIFRVLMSTRQHVRPRTIPHPLSWTRLNFDGADMTDVNMSSVQGENISLIGANLSRADLSHSMWFFGNFQRTQLRRTNMSQTDLSGACMEWADFEGVDLMHAKVEGAHFHHAHLRGADFSKAVGLTHEQIEEAHCWDDTTSWPEGFRPSWAIKRPEDECR
ncbi:pentapeptide repeat-containing protein [Arthrobacter sp. K5]|uniref:Pentapeptide repeat-containing protein n=1 Tax=Arthrobacter sp. K5 TaxID=2839623 RepID=A0AAU8EYC0_9MICC